eukprot:6211087-Pleurochrysis_carterae.AAC.4
MSVSGHYIFAAADRSAVRLICLRPEKRVCRVERRVGTHRSGSLQSQTWPHADRGIWLCLITTVGTCGTSTSAPPARARRAATAASARWNQDSTFWA